MNRFLFWSCMTISCLSGQFWAYSVVAAKPFIKEVQVVGECQQPPEVEHMVKLIELMNVTGTRSPEPRSQREGDKIAELIGSLK